MCSRLTMAHRMSRCKLHSMPLQPFLLEAPARVTLRHCPFTAISKGQLLTALLRLVLISSDPNPLCNVRSWRWRECQQAVQSAL